MPSVPNLPAGSTLDGDELVHIVDDPSGTPIDQKVTVDEIRGSHYAGLYKIDEVVLSVAAGNIDFQSIPQDFATLVVKGRLRVTKAATFGAVAINVNNDLTQANYQNEILQVGGSTVTATENLGTPSSRAAVLFPAASSNAADYGQLDVEIVDYTSTTRAKDINFHNNSKITRATGGILARNGILSYLGTAAVTRLTFTPYDAGVDIAAGSTISLYGVESGFG